MMNALLSFARLHPGMAAVIAVAILVGVYLLLNRKPKVIRDAELREQQLKDQNRDRYRHGRSL